MKKKNTEIKLIINSLVEEMLMVSLLAAKVEKDSAEKVTKELINKYKSKIFDIYNLGTNDAWNTAKQIESMTVGEVGRLFGISPKNGDKWVCNTLSYEEVKKILDTVINIEDEVVYVTDNSVSVGCGVVTNLFEVNNDKMACVLWKNGTSGCYKTSDLKRTGKTISLKNVLSQITG